MKSENGVNVFVQKCKNKSSHTPVVRLTNPGFRSHTVVCTAIPGDIVANVVCCRIDRRARRFSRPSPTSCGRVCPRESVYERGLNRTRTGNRATEMNIVYTTGAAASVFRHVSCFSAANFSYCVPRGHKSAAELNGRLLIRLKFVASPLRSVPSKTNGFWLVWNFHFSYDFSQKTRRGKLSDRQVDKSRRPRIKAVFDFAESKTPVVHERWRTHGGRPRQRSANPRLNIQRR